MTAISVRDLHKSYDGTEAVRGVGFDVAAGEVFCLLGPNGAGKTTTVEILEGYRLADSGQVRVLGADPARERGLRDRLGIVLQAGGLQPELTVAEVLEMYGRGYVPSRRVDELLALVELDAERDAREDGTVAEIAASLHLSPGTTRNHLSVIMGKLDAHSRIEAIRIAETKGWL